jgi:hypothetical protein
LRLQLGGQRIQLLGIDSGRLGALRTVKEIVLTPGNRADLLVTMVDGTAVLETQPYDRAAPEGRWAIRANGRHILSALDDRERGGRAQCSLGATRSFSNPAICP